LLVVVKTKHIHKSLSPAILALCSSHICQFS